MQKVERLVALGNMISGFLKLMFDTDDYELIPFLVVIIINLELFWNYFAGCRRGAANSCITWVSDLESS